MPTFPVIGILGGIASGKSLVSQILESHGAEVFHADRVGHEALSDAGIQKEIVRIFGQEILDADGNIHRPRLAKLVFGDSPERLRQLESVVHPFIIAKWHEFYRDAAGRHAEYVVLDAPLLLESGMKDLCDAILFIDTPLSRRQEFAARRGWPAEELAVRERRQLPLEEKRAAATWILDNSGSRASLETQLRDFLKEGV